MMSPDVIFEESVACNSIAMLCMPPFPGKESPAHVWSCHGHANRHLGGSAKT